MEELYRCAVRNDSIESNESDQWALFNLLESVLHDAHQGATSVGAGDPGRNATKSTRTPTECAVWHSASGGFSFAPVSTLQAEDTLIKALRAV
jgi:hypothetical protein